MARSDLSRLASHLDGISASWRRRQDVKNKRRTSSTRQTGHTLFLKLLMISTFSCSDGSGNHVKPYDAVVAVFRDV